MKKNLFNTVIFCALLLAIMAGLDLAYTTLLKLKPASKLAWIFNKQNETYDFAVLGDSRVLNCVDVKQVNYYANLKGINLGTSGSKPVENFLVLKHFLKSNKTTTVLLQLDATMGLPIVSPKNPKLPFYETFAFMPYIHDAEIYDVIAKYSTPIKHIPWKYIPFIRYAEFNYEFNLYKIFAKSESLMDETGYEATLKKGRAFPLYKAEKKFNTDSADINMQENLMWVQKIIGLCNENHIQLLFFTSPVQSSEFNLPLTNYSYPKLKKFSSDKEIPFWDWSKNYLAAPDSVFADPFHINYVLAGDFAKTIADSLIGLKHTSQQK